MNEKNYNFDIVVDRKNTRSVKWDETDEIFQTKDLLPLWIADMDFPSPRPVVNAIINLAQHKFFGYSTLTSNYYDAIINWYKRRHNWTIEKEWIIPTAGVIPAFSFAIQALSKPKDKIIIQDPAYPPFYSAIRNNKRRKLLNPLKYVKVRYETDFDDLEKKARDSKARLLILCSPHNPTGRVWTEQELMRLGEICSKNEIIIISDEIHCDITYFGNQHIPFASITEKFSKLSINMYSTY